MTSGGSMSTDLVGDLTPAPSIRPPEKHSPPPEVQPDPRRRPRREQENPDDSLAEGADKPAHQVDDVV